MRAVSLLVAITLSATPVVAQQTVGPPGHETPARPLALSRPKPIHASIERASLAAAEQTAVDPNRGQRSGRRRGLFWSGLALGVAGVTTSVLGLTALRTEESSTGNAPQSTYLACVAQKDSDPIYAANQCSVLKGKNLPLLWGGVALSGVGAALMIGGHGTSAELSSGTIGLFHRWRF